MNRWILAGLICLVAAEPAGADEVEDQAREFGLPILSPAQRERCWADEESVAVRMRALKQNPNAPADAKANLEADIAQTRKRLDECIQNSDAADKAQADAAARRDAAAKKQSEAEAASAEHDRLVAQRRQDPAWMSVALSAEICALNLERADVKSDIAKEKKYGALAGVVDKQKLYNYEQRIRQADENEARCRKGLAIVKAKATACSDKRMKQLAPCMPVYSVLDGERYVRDVPESCSAPELTSVSELLEIADDN